jgi:methionyl-tRNA formyltransferase
MNKKRVIALGSGQEMDFFVKNLFGKINLVAFGADPQNSSGSVSTISFCKERNIPIIDSYREIVSFEPDVVFMISYPLLIPKEYLSKCTFINMHGALLPEYRGIHGGTWAIINGEKFHGFTIHIVDEGIDSGPVLFQGKVEMTLEDDVNLVRERIFQSFKANIEVVFLQYLNNNILPQLQDEEKAKYVCRRKRQDSLVDWRQNAWNVFNLIRALKPPYTDGAFTYYREEPLYIISAEFYPSPSYIAICGQVVARFEGRGVLVKCGDGVILIKEVVWKGASIRADALFKSVGARFSMFNKNLN